MSHHRDKNYSYSVHACFLAENGKTAVGVTGEAYFNGIFKGRAGRSPVIENGQWYSDSAKVSETARFAQMFCILLEKV